jgi:hypothetical protein
MRFIYWVFLLRLCRSSFHLEWAFPFCKNLIRLCIPLLVKELQDNLWKVLSYGGFVSINLQHMMRLDIITSCNGRLLGFNFKYLDARDRVSCRVVIDILSWSQTINKYSTIYWGRGRGLIVNLAYLIKSLLIWWYFEVAFYCNGAGASCSIVIVIYFSFMLILV